ncbi:GNAT family N-acetyltransferase [Fibrella sp. HMF5335]|uniref:GNAT family N-acetyltransferase n=1 Tax=Fibrella rubiginis TaxID=2817060 RepID=A0A939GN45_9BACT|nr:GNAT family N-acetyltransferase [Fibrella rubiginis]MBO0939497.1 GNAT family N-acetyltransferase [Fibrella rubiginis]
MLRFLTRQQINDAAWNRCIDGAHNALVYGHTWYLDAVTHAPGWRWVGLVVEHELSDNYAAVLPVPLRKRWGRWVIYQPLFCQFLAIFSPQALDPTPFLAALGKRYRYASSLNLLLTEPVPTLPGWINQRALVTHVLPLTDALSLPPHQPRAYTHLHARYTPDRQMNLRRAAKRTGEVADWQVIDSENIEPLLDLFRKNHAESIGVGEWAYELFRGVFAELQQRGLITLRYTCVAGKPVAGAIFVQANGRVIYLFNAANHEGRRLNARTILLDEAVARAIKKATGQPLLFDFESPEKPGVVSFYESFGALPQAYIVLNWNRLTWLERRIQQLLSWLGSAVSGLKQT